MYAIRTVNTGMLGRCGGVCGIPGGAAGFAQGLGESSARFYRANDCDALGATYLPGGVVYDHHAFRQLRLNSRRKPCLTLRLAAMAS